MVYVSITLLAAFIVLLWVLRRDTLLRGKQESEKEVMGEVLKDVTTSKKIRNLIDTDPDVARIVRDKFTRK